MRKQTGMQQPLEYASDKTAIEPRAPVLITWIYLFPFLQMAKEPSWHTPGRVSGASSVENGKCQFGGRGPLAGSFSPIVSRVGPV